MTRVVRINIAARAGISANRDPAIQSGTFDKRFRAIVGATSIRIRIPINSTCKGTETIIRFVKKNRRRTYPVAFFDILNIIHIRPAGTNLFASICGWSFSGSKRDSAGIKAGVIMSVLIIRIFTRSAFMIGGSRAGFAGRVTGNLGLIDWNKAKEDDEERKDDFH